MEKIKDAENGLMKRRELVLKFEAEKTPSFAEVAKMISNDLKLAEDLIMVEGVKSSFGSRIFLIRASAYHTKELKDEAVKRLIKPKKEKTAEEAAPAE